jgi:HTH-type transcriptional regulator / antitoxin HigA
MSSQTAQPIDSIYALLARPASISFRDFVQSKFDELGITKNHFCSVTGVDNKTLSRILMGEAQKVDIVILIVLAQFLGIDYKELAQLYVGELEPDGVRKLQNARKAGFLLKHFDLKTLKRVGFINDVNDFDAAEKRIVRFFGFEQLYQYEHDTSKIGQLFSSTRRSPAEKMLHFWCAAAVHELRSLPNPYTFDIEQVKQVITRLSIQTSDEVDGLLNCVRALFRAGVTVMVNAYTGGTQVRGATFIVDNKPCIVLQDFKKKYSTLWFALAHELCHVVKDMDRIAHMRYHVSFDDDAKGSLFVDSIIERRADDFASELLLPESKLRYIAANINVPGAVKKCARNWQVSESIIYGHYAFKYNAPHFYSKVISAENAVHSLLIKPYESDSIEEAVAKVSHIYN